MKKIVIILLFLMLLAGCEKTTQIKCNSETIDGNMSDYIEILLNVDEEDYVVAATFSRKTTFLSESDAETYLELMKNEENLASITRDGKVVNYYLESLYEKDNEKQPLENIKKELDESGFTCE